MSGFGKENEVFAGVLRSAADQQCRECLGNGAHTCTACNGSCSASGDPVFDETWIRCRTCHGSGWELCACVDKERARVLWRSQGRQQ